MEKLIIAIDGPVSSGKSTVARRVAELLGYAHLDSGAMYRAVAWKALRDAVPLDAPERLEEMVQATRIDLDRGPEGMRVRVDGKDVTSAIRTPAVALGASKVAMLPGVRRVLVAQQQRAGAQGGVVMEGRDIGSVVFPNAELKIFLVASPEVRARRRWLEHQQEGGAVSLEQTLEEIHDRDRRDSQRAASPLVRAADAVLLDNTAMDAEETARLIILLAEARMESGAARRKS
ncbi:MAG TPA: (d)CMP kinase [Methylomirabilota bacterium]|nr:(d)CMP kinase [Methylomirabilota bacterium]